MDFNIKKIFDLFETKNKFNDKPDPQSFNDDYAFKLNMFSRFVTRGVVRKELLVDFFTELSKELDKEPLNMEGDMILFNRAYLYIKDFDKNDEKWQEAVKMSADENLSIALSLTKSYFEFKEEYEKCAHLYQIMKETEKILGSPKKNS